MGGTYKLEVPTIEKYGKMTITHKMGCTMRSAIQRIAATEKGPFPGLSF